MKVVGLITEYNPFHNGHKYHIEVAKRLTGADCAIAVMSGNFVQRGTPAVIDKYSRTAMALRNGIDLVLELPVCYSSGSAEYFAHGAVSLLDKLGIVDYLCFGSESGDINLLHKATQLIMNPPNGFDENLQTYMRNGLTYPAARLKALSLSLEEMCPTDKNALNEVLSEPNNILGIEYLKALHTLSSDIKPFTIQRTTAHYHDNMLSDTTISSATAIRKAIHSRNEQIDDYFKEIERSVPQNVFQLLSEQYLKSYPITEEDFSQIIKYKLLTENHTTLASYLDITADLADRIKNISNLDCSIKELADTIKTKNMTLTRINRALIHLLLNIRTEALAEYKANNYTPYARVLGVRKAASHLIRQIDINGKIPIITKVSKAKEQLDDLSFRMFSEDLFATQLYNQAVYEKYQTKVANEYKHGIVIL